jgi:sulfite reductase (NADPH) hemoprotein beta-component
VPWQQILVYIEAIVRVYNRYGRRDNLYKARIKILVKAEGQRFIDAVNAEFARILAATTAQPARSSSRRPSSTAWRLLRRPPACSARAAPPPARPRRARLPALAERNVHAHQAAGYRAVTLSLKRAGLPPGDARPSRWTAPPRWPTASAAASCASRTTRTCCCPGCSEAELPPCGRPPAPPVSPRPTSAC